MIDWKTILSSFDDNPTLLQWLKIVEKALQNASLEDVALKTTEDNKFVFEFKFADGSTVTSTPINFLKEISGVEKVSDEIVGTQTITTIRVDYIDGTSDDFSVAAKNGKDGKGIRAMNNVSNETVGNQTVTKIRAFYTDGTSQDLSVYAQNGSGSGSGETHIYMHEISGKLDDTGQTAFRIKYFSSSDNTPKTTVEEFLEFARLNKCYVTTAISDKIFYSVYVTPQNKIQISGYSMFDNMVIGANVIKIIDDVVNTV